MRLDFAFSVLTEDKNPIEIAKEEIKIKQEIGKLLFELGYQKFAVVDGDMMSEDVKPTLKRQNLED